MDQFRRDVSRAMLDGDMEDDMTQERFDERRPFRRASPAPSRAGSAPPGPGPRRRERTFLPPACSTPYGFVAGVQAVYKDGETDTVAKAQETLQPGDILEFGAPAPGR